jgi:hypothetical protein
MAKNGQRHTKKKKKDEAGTQTVGIHVFSCVVVMCGDVCRSYQLDR